MFLRLIFIAIIAWVVYKLWKRAGQKMAHRPQGAAAISQPAEMVSCAACGTFVLQHEAIQSGGRWYCSESCRMKK